MRVFSVAVLCSLSKFFFIPLPCVYKTVCQLSMNQMWESDWGQMDAEFLSLSLVHLSLESLLFNF